MNESFILLLFLVALLIKHESQSPLKETYYNATPLASFDQLIRKPAYFRNLFHFEPYIFLSKVVAGLLPNITFPRDYLLRNDYYVMGFVEKLRKCQISDIDRVCRN